MQIFVLETTHFPQKHQKDVFQALKTLFLRNKSTIGNDICLLYDHQNQFIKNVRQRSLKIITKQLPQYRKEHKT